MLIISLMDMVCSLRCVLICFQDLKDTLRRGGEVTYAEAHTRREREGLVQLATRLVLRLGLEMRVADFLYSGRTWRES